MAIFNSYVKLPEGIWMFATWLPLKVPSDVKPKALAEPGAVTSSKAP